MARPTKWGNPCNWKKYTLLTEPEAKEMAVEWYREWLAGEMVGRYYPEQKQWIIDHIHELAGKDLACWCKLGEPCHADVLLRLANKANGADGQIGIMFESYPRSL